MPSWYDLYQARSPVLCISDRDFYHFYDIEKIFIIDNAEGSYCQSNNL